MSLLETYNVDKVPIYVLRADLLSDRPAHGKCIGMKRLCYWFKKDGYSQVVWHSDSVSNLCLGVTRAALDNLMQPIITYMETKKGVPRAVSESQKLGAKLIPLRHNVYPVLLAQSRNIARNMHAAFVEYGGDHEEVLDAISQFYAEFAPRNIATLVLSSGSTVTMRGISRRINISRPHIISISSGTSLKTQESALRGLKWLSVSYTLIPPLMKHSEPDLSYCPFPSNQYWDRKAWRWLTTHIQELTPPVLFYNTGGYYFGETEDVLAYG